MIKLILSVESQKGFKFDNLFELKLCRLKTNFWDTVVFLPIISWQNKSSIENQKGVNSC